ncbi:hypothetical protein, partial [Klebsiella pneumoniae]|uniref:hypothetical protein n=1 Tax=Klebsiella pneumoniae TaxID=573 RepID=UPI0027386BB8
SSDIELDDVGHNGILKSGDQYSVTRTMRLPDGISGNYYILVFTDASVGGRIGISGLSGGGSGSVAEFRDEGNNIASAAMPILLTPAPDLRVSALTAVGPDATDPDHVLTGQNIKVTYSVTNAGLGATPDRQGSWDDYVYL